MKLAMSPDDPIRNDGTYSLTRGQTPAPRIRSRGTEPPTALAPPRAQPARLQRSPVEPIELPPPAQANDELLELALPAAEEELLELAPRNGVAPQAPEEYEAWHPPGEPAKTGDEELLAPAPAAATPSTYERAAQHMDRQLRIIAAPEPEPWWKRRLPHMITAVMLVCIVGYCYGCSEVMGNSIAFRRDLPEAGTELRNLNAAWKVVSPSDVEAAVRRAAHQHHLSVRRVTVIPHPLTANPTRSGGCMLVDPGILIGKVDPVDLARISRSTRTCTVPNYLLEVHAYVHGRWFLFADDFDEVAYILLNSWAPTRAAAAAMEAAPDGQ